VEHALGPVLDLAGGATVPVRAGLRPADPAVIDGDQSHETCADAIHSDDLEATIWGGLVSLDQIIETRWRSRPECNPDAAERQRFLRFLPELERLYGAGHGGAIQDTYFSRHILAGVVLTADHEIHLRYPPPSQRSITGFACCRAEPVFCPLGRWRTLAGAPDHADERRAQPVAGCRRG